MKVTVLKFLSFLYWLSCCRAILTLNYFSCFSSPNLCNFNFAYQILHEKISVPLNIEITISLCCRTKETIDTLNSPIRTRNYLRAIHIGMGVVFTFNDRTGRAWDGFLPHRNSDVKIGVRIVCPNINTDFSVTVRKLDIFNKKKQNKKPSKM